MTFITIIAIKHSSTANVRITVAIIFAIIIKWLNKGQLNLAQNFIVINSFDFTFATAIAFTAFVSQDSLIIAVIIDFIL